MKHLFGLTLLGCLAASACASPQPAKTVAMLPPSATRNCQGPVTIATRADVTSVAAACATIDGDLRILETHLTDLDGLENLQSVRNLVILNNSELASIAGLHGLRAAAGVTIMGNPSLRTLDGLEAISNVRGVVIVGSGVTSLHGLDGLRAAQEVVIVGNPSLKTLAGMSLQQPLHGFVIEGNGAFAHQATRAPLASARNSNEHSGVSTFR